MKFFRYVYSNDKHFSVGDELIYGAKRSYYYEKLVNNSKSFVNKDNGEIVTYKNFDRLHRRNTAPDIVREVDMNRIKAKKDIDREIVFEQVRAAFYKKMPSRKKCGFACSSVDIAFRFEPFLSYGDARYVQLVEMEPVGKVNYAECDDEYLFSSGSESELSFYDNAHKYWKGEGSKRKELLIEGKFKIIKIIKNVK